jgi:transposase
MTACRKEVARLERQHARTTVRRVTLDEVHPKHRKGPLYEVRLVVAVPGGELIVHRTPPEASTDETVEVALRAAFAKIRRRLADYWERRIDSKRRRLV